MRFQKVQLRRRGGLFEQGAQIAQAPGAVMQGGLGRLFQGFDRMLLRQRQQAIQNPDADGATLLHHRLGPTAGLHANQPRPIQQMLQTLLDDVAVRRMQMVRIGGELAWFGQRMHGNDLPALIEHPQHPRLPTRPDLPAHILWRHGVVSPLQLNVAIPMHRAWRFFKDRKQTRRQGQQLGAFHFLEHLANLLPRGAMNAGVGHAAFPLREKQVLRRQTFKAAALEGVVLGKLHARLNLAFVPRHGWTCRQHHGPVVAAELCHLGVDLRIVPVRPRHRRPQVVNDQGAGNPAEVTERIFEAPDEALSRLLPDHFAVAFARMTQDDPKQMGPLPFAFHQHPCPLTKIHLGFGSRRHFHPHKRHRLGLPQMPDEPFYGLITARESVLTNQVLINALGTQPDCHRRFNLRLPGWQRLCDRR